MGLIDVDQYMGLLKEQYLHSKAMHDTKAARAWQGAMQLLYDQPTLPQPSNEPLTPCNVCRFSPPSSGDGKPCCMCPADRRPPEGEDNA